MAASGLDHLKNGYRSRFCRSSRAPDIEMVEGKSILVILKDCFEEKSLADDFSTNSSKSVLYSTPKIKDTCLKSPSRKAHCQKSLPRSVTVSSTKKRDSQQFTIETRETVKKSVQAHEVQKILVTDVGSKNTPDSRKMSDKKLKGHHNEAVEEFYLAVDSPSVVLNAKTPVSTNSISSIAQKSSGTYTLENSVNTLSSNTEISLKTKKRLKFENKDILEKVEIESNISDIEDEVSERKTSGISQNRTQDSEYEIQPQTKKSFSTLFLETLKGKSESSPIVRHIVSAPHHSSAANDTKLLEDEFIIDESDRSFASRAWITIPRKALPGKQRTVSPPESTALLRSKKSKEKHHSALPMTLSSDKHSGKAYPVEKSQLSGQEKLDRPSFLTDEMDNNYRSTKCEMYSKNVEKSSGSKRTVKQQQKRKFKAIVVEEQAAVEQTKDKNINMSHTAQDKSQRNFDKKAMEEYKEKRNVHSPKKQMPSGGSKKSSNNVLYTKNQKKKNRVCEKKDFSDVSKKNKFVPEEVMSTVTRSRRISRRPSNWWVVKSGQSFVYSDSSIIHEMSVHHNSRQKPTEKTNQLSENIGEKAVPFKDHKRANPGCSRALKILNAKDSRGIINHDEISGCSQNESLECDEADMDMKKNPDHSGVTSSPKDEENIMTAQNVHLNPQTSGYPCETPAESDSDSVEPETFDLESSGPSRLKNYLISGKNNSDENDEEVQQSSGTNHSRVKRYRVTGEKKMHQKFVLPSNTPNVRRTKRTRLKPLEYWRGERVDYQERPSGGFVVGGILSPGIIPSKRKAKGEMKKVNKIVKRKKMCLDNDGRENKLVVNVNIPLGDPLQPTRVKDPETRKMILMDLLKPRDTYQFLVEHGELKVYKILDTPLFSTGKLILGPCQEKGKQHVGLDTLVFYVKFGDLICTLHETSYIVTTGDSFFVPSGNYYNIKNLLNEESILLFTQIKR